jgi:hypothetical protein
LIGIGLVAMAVGMLDPLEGSPVVVAGTGAAAVGAWFDGSGRRKVIYWSFALVAFGVAALWRLSALGGFGGTSGRSVWWGLTIVPYPVGWLLGLVGAVRELRAPLRR